MESRRQESRSCLGICCSDICCQIVALLLFFSVIILFFFIGIWSFGSSAAVKLDVLLGPWVVVFPFLAMCLRTDRTSGWCRWMRRDCGRVCCQVCCWRKSKETTGDGGNFSMEAMEDVRETSRENADDDIPLLATPSDTYPESSSLSIEDEVKKKNHVHPEIKMFTPYGTLNCDQRPAAAPVSSGQQPSELQPSTDDPCRGPRNNIYVDIDLSVGPVHSLCHTNV